MIKFLQQPTRDWVIITLLVVALGVDFVIPSAATVVWVVAAIGALATFQEVIEDTKERRLTIATFNSFALIVSFVTGNPQSAAFIGLMLASARLLEWRTQTRARNAVAALLKLKPTTATRERNGVVEDVPVERIKTGDTIIIRGGEHVPVDGIVIAGESTVNEASVTGESQPIAKGVGSALLAGTRNESSILKMKATRVGKDSTIERMAGLMQSAAAHKSHAEHLADRFTEVFLPIVAILGVVTYVVTKNPAMVAALFLVACADDMAIAIPLAITASLGQAAARGVIIRGGEWLTALARLETLVIDKTGTLTHGTLRVENVELEPSTADDQFWRVVGALEKYSEHPIGKAVVSAARAHVRHLPDPDSVRVVSGGGIVGTVDGCTVVIGNEQLFTKEAVALPPAALEKFRAAEAVPGQSAFAVAVNGTLAGIVRIADTPRPEAAASIRALRALGIRRVIMLTGDNERIAATVANALGITEYHAAMQPEDKLHALESLTSDGVVGMVGDGINDAPALARADVGIAMGGAGTAVAVEAADIVVTTDNLGRIPEMVKLGRRTTAVIRWDIAIWIAMNVVGFALVFTSIIGPALAAIYNFVTDFLPLMNSTRLFRGARRS